MNPQAEYQSRLAARQAVANREQKRFRWIGNARLFTAIAGVAVAFFIFGETVLSPWWLVAPVALFAGLVVFHARVVERWERANRAAIFYGNGIARLEDRWAGTGEAGERFRNPAHVYGEDLDLFGKGSMFQLLCTARTRSGEDALSGWLLAPASRADALARQEAVRELTPLLDLREELAIIGDTVRSELHPEEVAAWGEAPEVAFPPLARLVAPALAAAVVATFCLYMAGVWTRTPFLAALLAALAYWALLGARTLRVTSGVNAPARDLALLSELLERVEKRHFEAPALCALQQRLAASGLLASAEINRLRRLVSLLDWQRNLLFTPIAWAIFWSPQLAMAIEQWRKVSGAHVRDWIAGAGEFEALCALAGYSWEHPADTFPELVERSDGWFEAEGLGHPLLPESGCVRNDLRLGGDIRLMIVSGSNMSGKSTLLRATGLNAVLAWAGAPVRAQRLRISPLAVGASIRVLDSLADGRSRFYAEITRLRDIVFLAEGPGAVLFLVDELLSGTNSHDRRIGAGAIVRMLLDHGAIGMITTHDLALASIAADLSGRAVNVHFADSLQDGRLHFDYRLLPGIVERSNALDLMRAVGFEV